MSMEINQEAIEQLSIADLTVLIEHFKDARKWIPINMANEDPYTQEYKDLVECESDCQKQLNKRIVDIFII